MCQVWIKKVFNKSYIRRIIGLKYPETFLSCIEVVLKNEGGYVNNSSDPGGETNMGGERKYGISKRSYPSEDIKNLTKERAIKIYYKDYWLPMNLMKLEDEDLILQIFDFGVNAGAQVSIKLLQKLVDVEEDGIIGKTTAKVVNSQHPDITDRFKKRRKMFYINLAGKKPELAVFLKGWLNRVDKTTF